MTDVFSPAPAPDGLPVRVRFCPSPTGSPHVGLARTALFNWAYARHTGGTVVFRMEDTDAARSTQESFDTILEVMRWLGFDWDEGVGVGGPHGPYVQTERYDIYRDVVQRLLDAGLAYRAYDTPEELEERREAARREGRPSGYDGAHRHLTDEQRAAYEAEGREPVIRFAMTDDTITFTDLVRGDISFDGSQAQDFVIMRANGDPLYTLVNPVDDAMMGITHVLRGEDLLSSTPRQIALYEALARIGVGAGHTPRFAHLPYVTGQGNKKLSKRDPEAHLLGYREQGFLPEGLINYLALLGWSIAEDRDVFTRAEMYDAFDLSTVNPNPARFDLKKATAINAEHVRMLPEHELAGRVVPYLRSAGLLADSPSDEQRRVLEAATPLIQSRMNVLSEAVDMLRFLFVDGDDFVLDEADAAKLLDDRGTDIVRASLGALETLGEWTTDGIESALRSELLERQELKPRVAFGPVRVAVTGRRVSPPLFESLELLGRERSLARLAAAADR